MLYGQLRKNLGDVFHDLARQKGEQCTGRAFAIRSCAHVDLDLDTAEICSCAGGWLYEGEECDLYSTDLPRPAEKL